jgi:8-oxo-dGTP diphosphatase
MQDATLVILLKGKPISEILLGYKKIGFGQGKYTGFGGKIERGEDVAEAALRELAEETGVRVPSLESLDFRARLEFRFPHKRSWDHRVFVFCTHLWEGVPTESNEMIPQWFPIEEIPYNQMWDDARHWLPLIISGETFRAHFKFRRDNATVEKITFEPLNG